MRQVLTIARGIANGEKDQNLCCSELGEINRELDWPEELSALIVLAIYMPRGIQWAQAGEDRCELF